MVTYLRLYLLPVLRLPTEVKQVLDKLDDEVCHISASKEELVQCYYPKLPSKHGNHDGLSRVAIG